MQWETSAYSFSFFLGPGRALGFAPSTPAPRPRFDPAFGLTAFVAFFPPASLDEGRGVPEPVVSAGGEDASGSTVMGFDSSSDGAVAVAFRSGVCFVRSAGEGASSGMTGAKHARALLDNFRHTILLALDPLGARLDDGGVENFARPLDARRIALLVFEVGGMSTRRLRVDC